MLPAGIALKTGHYSVFIGYRRSDYGCLSVIDFSEQVKPNGMILKGDKGPWVRESIPSKRNYVAK